LFFLVYRWFCFFVSVCVYCGCCWWVVGLCCGVCAGCCDFFSIFALYLLVLWPLQVRPSNLGVNRMCDGRGKWSKLFLTLYVKHSKVLLFCFEFELTSSHGHHPRFLRSLVEGPLPLITCKPSPVWIKQPFTLYSGEGQACSPWVSPNFQNLRRWATNTRRPPPTGSRPSLIHNFIILTRRANKERLYNENCIRYMVLGMVKS